MPKRAASGICVRSHSQMSAFAPYDLIQRDVIQVQSLHTIFLMLLSDMVNAKMSRQPPGQDQDEGT